MAKSYVKGDAVENATSYELLEEKNGAYTSLTTQNSGGEINIEVSALGLAAGDHNLVVKAKADGYEDSEYSDPVVYTVVADDYVSYKGAEDFSFVGVRVQTDTNTSNTVGWKEATTGSTSAATDFLEVNSNNKIWIQYCAVVNNSLASGGFYDADKNLVAPLNWDTFGIDQAANSSAKFITPENPASIADIEATWDCSIKYVRFVAWDASDGGMTNTEARIITPA